MTRSRLFLLGVSFALVTGCGTAPEPEPTPAFRPTATIKDIMDSLVDPSADALWESVYTNITEKGIEEIAPRTDEEWTTVRRRAVELLEATNLLVMEGRHVAKPGEKAADPSVELTPEEIDHLIAEDRQAWVALAHGLHDAALPALAAIDAKNAQALMNAGEAIDTACENCHLKYWYPKAKAASAPATTGP